jgi:hypothetical protein
MNAQGDQVKAVQTNLTKVGLTVPALKQPKMGNNIGARSKHSTLVTVSRKANA